MNMMNREPERHEIEALLPWHATGTLSRRDADRVEQALASDRELARRYHLVREELAETIHLNETLGAPSPRCMEKLFAMVDAEEARAPRRRRGFDLTARITELLAGLAPRTLAWSAAVGAVAIMLQAGVIAAVMMRDSGPNTYGVANAASDGTFAVVRFAPQATFAEISNFLGAYKATVVEGPVKAGSMYRIRLSDTPLPANEVNKIIQQMQSESRIVGFAAQAAAPQQ
jgi:hypothetical protein